MGNISPFIKKTNTNSLIKIFNLLLRQVANWLLALSMEMYIPRFLDSAVDGEVLLTLDSTLLKQLGVINKSDRDKIKDKLKELKKQNDKEKKELEKERKKKEKESKSFPNFGRR